MKDYEQTILNGIYERCLKIFLGGNTLRGFEEGTKEKIVTFISQNISNSKLKVALSSRGLYEKFLSRKTKKLGEVLNNWGLARKAISLFIRELVYNVEFSSFLFDGPQERMSALRFIHPPIDRLVVNNLSNKSNVVEKWPGYVNLEKYYNTYLDIIKAHLTQIEKSESYPLIHADLFLWNRI